MYCNPLKIEDKKNRPLLLHKHYPKQRKMKQSFFIALLLFLAHSTHCQNLIIKGRIRCLNQSAQSTKGAENIIVVPTFKPSRSAITASSPTGYFEFNTGLPLSTLQDKQVQIYIVSSCGQCKNIVKRVFISEDQDRQNKDDSKSYVTVRNWIVDKHCNQIELTTYKADSILQVIQKQPELKPSQLNNVTAVTGTPALLNLLTTLTTVLVPVPPALGIFKALELKEGDINYGTFLWASALTHTANTGFNFAPTRDYSEAALWNPSAQAFSRGSNNISMLTNVKNNVKFSSFFKLTDKLHLGVGGIFTQQDEFRDGNFIRESDQNIKLIDSVEMNLKEYAAFLNSSYRMNNRLSIGITLKSIWQDFNIPQEVNIQNDDEGNPINTFTDIAVEKQNFEVDFSATYRISKSFTAGFNAMNLTGTELYADAFTPRQQYIAYQQQRSLGFGLSYKWQRLNIGTDVVFTEDGFYDAAIGANFVPFNDALLSAGYAIEQGSYSVGLRLKHFRLAYINDNDFLANERRKGKSNFLNGRLYGGFSFYF